MRKRDERQKVMLSARMLSDKGWSDVAVRDLSPGGMMIVADTRLKPGKCIEIRRAPYTIVARIVWTNGKRIGLRAQDPIDVRGLIAVATGGSPDGLGKIAERRDPGTGRLNERRAPDRPIDARVISSRFQFVLLIASMAISAWLIADSMGAWFAAPLKLVRQALGGTE